MQSVGRLDISSLAAAISNKINFPRYLYGAAFLMPAITKNQYGEGFTYYIGTNMDQEGIDKVLKMATHQADIHPVVDEPTALEVVCRKTADSTHYYIFNFKETDIVIPDQFVGFTDLLTGKKVESGMRMKQYDALILNMPDSGV